MNKELKRIHRRLVDSGQIDRYKTKATQRRRAQNKMARRSRRINRQRR
jgi:hypothetical protein